MFRIGQGFDVHAFFPDRKLIIGGVEIPYAQGLMGHSDADVLLHAICDALLGALALGDIGKHFPNTDDYEQIDSRILLRHVVGLVHQQGYIVHNIDSTVIAERPQLFPYTDKMRFYIAQDCQIVQEMVSVKASTTDKLGFSGRGEGITALAICLLFSENLSRG